MERTVNVDAKPVAPEAVEVIISWGGAFRIAVAIAVVMLAGGLIGSFITAVALSNP